MNEQETSQSIPDDDQVAAELRSAVHAGDAEAIQRLIRNDPALATARLGSKDSGTATPLHLVTDWPGYFPNGPQIVRLLIDAGANPNALTTSRGAETSGPGDEMPLHYVASSDDADVAEALIEGGADIEVPDGSIGTPLDNAVGYGCWHVARLLVAGRPRRQGLARSRPGHAQPLRRIPEQRPASRSRVTSVLARLHQWPAPRRGVPAVTRRRSQRGAGLCPRYAAGASGHSTQQENVITWLRAMGANSASVD
jgi:ankyrin repeat protein